MYFPSKKNTSSERRRKQGSCRRGGTIGIENTRTADRHHTREDQGRPQPRRYNWRRTRACHASLQINFWTQRRHQIKMLTYRRAMFCSNQSVPTSATSRSMRDSQKAGSLDVFEDMVHIYVLMPSTQQKELWGNMCSRKPMKRNECF
jgi:hypothetical protein